jgi:hypothetical protein
VGAQLYFVNFRVLTAFQAVGFNLSRQEEQTNHTGKFCLPLKKNDQNRVTQTLPSGKLLFQRYVR